MTWSDESNLEVLRKLTPRVSSFPKELGESRVYSKHRMACGTSLASKILEQKEILACDWFNSNGTSFPTHSHDEREILIVYLGSMLLRIADEEEERRLLPGHVVVIEPKTEHTARFLEDCWYLAITIPAATDWFD